MKYFDFRLVPDTGDPIMTTEGERILWAPSILVLFAIGEGILKP